MNWKLLEESRNRYGNSIYYKVKFNEAVNELRDSMIDDNLFCEADNKILNTLKEKLAKVCPSPEKIKDFFLGIGKKIDGKIQGCKYESLKNAWNSIKEMALAQDAKEISPEEAGLETPQGNDQAPEQDAQSDDAQGEEEGGEGNEEEQIAAESYYNEGIWDKIKGGWNSLATPDAPAKKPAKSGGRKAPAKKAPAKKAPAKKPTATKKPVKGGSTKKPVAKKPAAKKPTKSGSKATKQLTAKEKILKFLREHWKQITIILLAALAVGLLGAWIAGAFASSSAVSTAAGVIAKKSAKWALPFGMKALPKGARLIGNGMVKLADGSIVQSNCTDSIDSDDINID